MNSSLRCSTLLVLSSIFAIVYSEGLFAQATTAQDAPHLFAPGVVSTADFEFGASFTPDGKTVYFSKGDPAYNRITIVESHLKRNRWTEPEVSSFSGVWKDTDAHVTPDGRKIFFISNRPADGSHTPRKDYDIWYVEAQPDKTWGPPHHLGTPINTDGNEAYPSVTADGTMYFEASRQDHPGTHIYRSRYVNGQYMEPELLNFAGKGNDINPAVASDGSFMIFASRDRGGQGSSDLFISFANRDGTWTEPTNMGAINSRFAETAPGLSPDNRKLYFASNRIDEPLVRTTPANYKQLEHELHEIQNGLLNIYEVDLGDVQRFTKR
jgi:Tol biopolymer transport system component